MFLTELPPRKRLCIAPGPRFEIGESSSAPTARPTGGFRRDYGFVANLDTEIRRDQDREIGYGITDDTYEIYGRLDDAQDNRSLMSGQLNLLHRDRRSYAHTARLMKAEARASREACRPQMTSIAHKGTGFAEDIADSEGSTTESEGTR
ncbi:hypothetical protein Tco_0017587 [Tanacetum coccineum]